MIDKNFENNNFGGDDDGFRRSLGAAMSDKNNSAHQEGETCPWYEMLSRLIMCPKPFGMPWSRDQMCDFLKRRGYRIVNKFNEKKRESFPVVVRPDSESIPELEETNLGDIFATEIQNIILNWLVDLDRK